MYQIRPLWRHFTDDVSALIYVVDASDPERVPEVTKEFAYLMAELEDREDISILIFFNKQVLNNFTIGIELIVVQDMQSALTIDEVSKQMDLKSYNHYVSKHVSL